MVACSRLRRARADPAGRSGFALVHHHTCTPDTLPCSIALSLVVVAIGGCNEVGMREGDTGRGKQPPAGRPRSGVIVCVVVYICGH
jgi:hypothetical protein